MSVHRASKRDAKIHALRMATAAINFQLDGGIELTDDEKFELSKIAEKMEERAVKMGGPFNPYTGMPFPEKEDASDED